MRIWIGIWVTFVGVVAGMYRVDRSILESTTLLAEHVSETYFHDLGRQCFTIVADTGYMSDFKSGYNLTVFRISVDACNSTFAGKLLESFYHNCFWWVVQVSKPACFYEAWKEAHHSSYSRQNPGFFFLPITLNPGRDYDDFFLSEDINELVPKLLIAKFEETDKWPVKLLTNEFYSNAKSLVQIDEWSPAEGFRHKNNLFPDKTKNLNGKGLRISAVPYPSYVIRNITSDNLDGAEVRIMLTFCELYNCTVSYVYDGNLWGEIYPENKTGVGELGLVYAEKSDFGASANYLWVRFYNYTDFTMTYMEGALTCVVPKEREILGWAKPFKVFNPIMWLSVVLCLMASSVTLYVSTFLTMRLLPDLAKIIREKQQFTSPVDSVIRSLGMSLLQQPSGLVQGSPVRHIFTAFEFVYFVLSSMYAAKLAAELTIPQFTQPIDTVRSLAEENLIWLVPDSVFVEGIIYSELPMYKTIVKNVQLKSYEEINKLALTGMYGMAVERMGEGTPYGEKMNGVIGSILNAGLFPYWVGDVTRRYQNYSIQQALQYASKVHVEDSAKKLTVAHFAGAFILYAVGLLISVGVLFSEIISHRMKTSNRADVHSPR